MEKLVAVIRRAQLPPGAWRQGGSEARAIYDADDKSYMINYEKGSVWVQGKQALPMHTRLNAARSRA